MPDNTVVINPVDMTIDTMSRLEDKGLIYRIAPGKDTAGPVSGANLGRSIYVSDAKFGPHKLIVATIDIPNLGAFGYHEDNEDVFLLDAPGRKPMFFVIATCKADEFNDKVAKGALSPGDFACLRARYNDPEVSLFVMNKFVPHGEFVLPSALPSPSFYVTEPADMPIIPVGFGGHRVEMRDGDIGAVVSP